MSFGCEVITAKDNSRVDTINGCAASSVVEECKGNFCPDCCCPVEDAEIDRMQFVIS
jgi:hypothetical protein